MLNYIFFRIRATGISSCSLYFAMVFRVLKKGKTICFPFFCLKIVLDDRSDTDVLNPIKKRRPIDFRMDTELEIYFFK